jgi:hypothetical protein
MSTRGAFGVRIDGQTKATYNHSDSYPTGLGRDLVEQIKSLLSTDAGLARFEKLARSLKLVDSGVPPTFEDVVALRKYTDLGVGNQSTSDWYCLTRKLQGDLASILEVGYMLDYGAFLTNFDEWMYIVNLDDGKFEVYTSDTAVASYPLNAIPEGWDVKLEADD